MDDRRYKHMLLTATSVLLMTIAQAAAAEQKYTHGIDARSRSSTKPVEISQAPDDIVWGESVDGIAAGIRIKDGVESYGPDQLLSFEVWIKNDTELTQEIDLPRSDEVSLEKGDGVITFTHVMKERFQKWRRFELPAAHAYRDPDLIPRFVTLDRSLQDEIEFAYPAFETEGPLEVSFTPVRTRSRSDDFDETRELRTGIVRLVPATQADLKGDQAKLRSTKRIQIQWGSPQGNLRMGVSALPLDNPRSPTFTPQVWLKNLSTEPLNILYHRTERSSPWRLDIFDRKPKLKPKKISGASFIGLRFTHQRTIPPETVVNVSEVSPKYHRIENGKLRAAGNVFVLKENDLEQKEQQQLESGTLDF